MTLSDPRHQFGQASEAQAEQYLLAKGYRILERNLRTPLGELDLVAEDGAVLVFVEVKARRSKEYGAPEDAVTVGKQHQIRKTSEGYLFEKIIDERSCRFDIVAIDLSVKEPAIRHIEDAF